MDTTKTTPPATDAVEDALDFFTNEDLESQLPDHEIETFKVAGGIKRRITIKRLKGTPLIKAISDGNNAAALEDRLALKLKRCVLTPSGEPHFTDVSVRKYLETCEGETINEMIAAVHRVNTLLKNV